MARYVVTSKVKELVKSLGLSSSSDLPDALDKKVEEIIRTAVERAKANGRKTLRSYDL